MTTHNTPSPLTQFAAQEAALAGQIRAVAQQVRQVGYGEATAAMHELALEVEKAKTRIRELREATVAFVEDLFAEMANTAFGMADDLDHQQQGGEAEPDGCEPVTLPFRDTAGVGEVEQIVTVAANSPVEPEQEPEAEQADEDASDPGPPQIPGPAPMAKPRSKGRRKK